MRICKKPKKVNLTLTIQNVCIGIVFFNKISFTQNRNTFSTTKAFDEELAYQTLMDINEGKTVQIPIYDKKSYRNTDKIITITPETVPDVIIFEGLLVFYYPKIRELCNMKLFVDCDADTRLSRRVQRDMEEYKRPLEHILGSYCYQLLKQFNRAN